MDPPYWQTEGYGVPFEFDQYEQMADIMRTSKGKIMVSINDHPDIRRVFAGFSMHETSIKYSVANNHSAPVASGELIIMNWEGSGLGQLF